MWKKKIILIYNFLNFYYVQKIPNGFCQFIIYFNFFLHFQGHGLHHSRFSQCHRGPPFRVGMAKPEEVQTSQGADAEQIAQGKSIWVLFPHRVPHAQLQAMAGVRTHFPVADPGRI